MSNEDHPVFRYKDTSNNKMDRAQRLIKKYRKELEQVECDLKFLDIMMREFGR